MKHFRHLYILSLSLLFVSGSWAVNPNSDVSVQDINRNSIAYNNVEVAFSGEVEKVIGKNSFRIDGDKDWYNDEILVFVPEGIDKKIKAGTLAPGDKVSVIGTVRNTAVVEVVSKLGYDLDPEIEIELEEVNHYIEAKTVVKAREKDNTFSEIPYFTK